MRLSRDSSLLFFLFFRSASPYSEAFKHNCVGDLELLLQEAVAGKQRYSKILVIVEGIYSMEGELCCLPDIVRMCKMYGAYVWLDEAHSIGGARCKLMSCLSMSPVVSLKASGFDINP